MPTLYSGTWHCARLPPPQALLFSHMTGDEAQGTMGRRKKEFSHVFSFPPSFARKNFIERVLVLVARQEFWGGYLKNGRFFTVMSNELIPYLGKLSVNAMPDSSSDFER